LKFFQLPIQRIGKEGAYVHYQQFSFCFPHVNGSDLITANMNAKANQAIEAHKKMAIM